MTDTAYGAIPNDGNDDSPAFQAAINALVAAGGGCLDIPDGNYTFNSQVSVSPGTWFVTIRGLTSSGAHLHSNNSNGVFQISETSRAEQITVQNLVFVADQPAAGTALAITTLNPGGDQQKRVVTVDNVAVSGSSTNYFKKGFVVTGLSRPIFMNCSFSMPTTDIDYSDTSINFQPTSGFDISDCYAAVCQDCSVDGASTAFYYHTTPGQNPEDGAFRSCTANHCKIGIEFYQIKDATSNPPTDVQPTLWITSCNICARDFGARVTNRRILQITDSTFSQASSSSSLVDVELDDCRLGIVQNNLFSGALSGGRKNIVVGSGGLDLILGANTLSDPNTANSISIAPSLQRVFIYQ